MDAPSTGYRTRDPQQAVFDDSSMCHRVCRGLRRQLDGDKATLDSIEEGNTDKKTFKKFYDHVKGGELDPDKVAEARKIEIAYVKKMGLYHKVPRYQCRQKTGKSPIKVRWVDTNKGSEDNPQYRSRLVAMEFNRGKGQPEWFSATPPLESLKTLLSQVATAQYDPHSWGTWAANQDKKSRSMTVKEDDCVAILYTDVSRAYFHAEAQREVYVDLVPEDCLPGQEDYCGLLRKSMYGTRDAASNWETLYSKVLIENGFVRGKASPCIYYHRNFALRVLVHGDDFVGAGPHCYLQWLRKIMDQNFECRHELFGPAPDMKKEIRVLNRKITWGIDGIQYQSDSRHAAAIVKDLGLQGAKGVATPTEHDSEVLAQMRKQGRVVHDRALEKDDHVYRSIAARANYLALDRADLQFAAKRCAKGMANPTVQDWHHLKRLGRYLIRRPRLEQVFEWQVRPKDLLVETDSDWAGDHSTRKSTTGGCIFLGRHCVKSWSKDQSVIALSSGEAELYAANFGAAQCMGLCSILRDWGWRFPMKVMLDSTACIGMLRKVGLGKAKHIETNNLWMQEKVRNGSLVLGKVDTKSNRADLGTKPLTADTSMKHWKAMGFKEV